MSITFSALEVSLFFIGTGIVFVLILFWRSAVQKKIQFLEFSLHSAQEKYRVLSLEMSQKEHKTEYIIQSLENTKAELQKKEWEAKALQKEFFEKSNDLTQAKTLFEKQTQEMVESKKQQQKEKEENIYRQWNEFEEKAIAQLSSVCSKQHTFFSFYTNKNLPQVFDGSIKPDFCISLAKKYVVFDAKKSKNSNTYIPDQAKITAQKYKDIPFISSLLFFVIPESEHANLSSHTFFAAGQTISVIPPSAIESTLVLLKRIESFETLEHLPLEEREKVIHLLGEYKNHVSLQNAIHILLAEHSFSLESGFSLLPKEFSTSLQKDYPLPFSLQKAVQLAKNTEGQKRKVSKMRTAKIPYEAI